MAEGWARHLKGDQLQASSAGLVANGLHPDAVHVMAESGVDISAQRSQTLEEFENQSFDLVVTVCSHADQHCPTFPGSTRVVHVGFDDPPTLAAKAKSPEEALGFFRRVRDEIRNLIATLPEGLLDSGRTKNS
jgi:arsenate reductase